MRKLKPPPPSGSGFPPASEAPANPIASKAPLRLRSGQALNSRPDAKPVGLVTALYRGRAHGTLPSRLEALGIATDFQAGVLLSKMIEGGLHYGLGSTLAVRPTTTNWAGASPRPGTASR